MAATALVDRRSHGTRPVRRVVRATDRPPVPGAAAGPDTPARQLEMALTDLAEVLAVYPFRSDMPVCSHCITDDDQRLLARQPARLPSSVIDRFVAKAMITWGEVPDFKRVLPEILSRTTRGGLAVPEGLIGARLRRAGWQDWPAAEAPAVRRTLRAAWLDTLAQGPGPGRTPAPVRLSLIVTAERDLAPYLDLWEDRLEAPGNPAARLHAVLHLAELLGPLTDGGRRRLQRSVPLARRGVVAQLDQWLRQPLVIRRLAHAADALRGTVHEDSVERGRAGLARLRTDR